MERQRGISANRNNNPGWHMAKLCQSGKNKLNENGKQGNGKQGNGIQENNYHNEFRVSTLISRPIIYP